MKKAIARFRFDFPDKINEARESLKKRSQRVEEFYQTIKNKLNTVNGQPASSVGRLKAGLLLHAMEDSNFKDNLDTILRVRAFKQLSEEVNRQLTKAKESIEQSKEQFKKRQTSPSILYDTPSLPQKLRDAIKDVIRKKLPELLEKIQAQEEDRMRMSEWEEELRKIVKEEIFGAKQSSFDRFIVDNTEKHKKTILEELMLCQQRTFVRRTPNPVRRGFCLIFVPRGVEWQGGPDQLQRFLKSNAQAILNCKTQIVEYEESNIRIYYEDLFHPASNIRGIRQYFTEYDQETEKELFHIDRRFTEEVAFQDLMILTEEEVITCGNDECSYDISSVPTGELLCPGCGKIIKSRCGNSDCTQRHLNLSPQKHSKSCPTCGGFNQASWWRCYKHGKLPVVIHTDKEYCPECFAQYQKDRFAFPFHKISLRPDLVGSEACPNCLKMVDADSSHDVFIIPKELITYYRYGINGGQKETFEKVAAKYKVAKEGQCPNCRTHLLPFHHQDYPNTASFASSDKPIWLFNKRHYINPSEAPHVFITARRPEAVYDLVCGKCGFPIGENDTVCLRCQTSLRVCPICESVTHQRSYESDKGDTCPICETVLLPLDNNLGNLDGSFCTNLYGCPAGGLLTKNGQLAMLPPDVDACPICKHPHLKPLPIKTFLYLIRQCHHCTNVYAESTKWKNSWRPTDALRELSPIRAERKDACPLCGRLDFKQSEESYVVGTVGSPDQNSGMILSVSEYGHMAELSRALVMNGQDSGAVADIFNIWFDSTLDDASSNKSKSVSEIIDSLELGILMPDIEGIVRPRLEVFRADWERKLYKGLAYRPPKSVG